MAIFGSNKNKSNNLQPLPDFPEMPEEENVPEFPSYEPTIREIKKEVNKPSLDDDFEIPEIPTRTQSKPTHRIATDGEKPLFVKVSKYKEAVKDLESLKMKIEEAEDILQDVEHLKEQERIKLEQWKADLQDLKEKLLSIDERLFEV